MSEFGDNVDAILAKAGSAWTKEEYNIIADLIKAGHRARLKQLMGEIRPADFKAPKEARE